MPALEAIPGLNPASYRRSELHAPERVWVEKNCYIDIWIELLHALGLEPLAVMGFTLAIDFEGDQWTFFKPPHEALRNLYGVDVQELYVWRTLLEHGQEHLSAGKLISTEADAYWLPDTAGTDYRSQHTKTTIVLNSIDVQAGRLGYFHNAGYFSVDGEDFRRLFRLDAAPDPTYMPLFAELVRYDRRRLQSPQALRSAARQLLREQVARLPVDNPVRRFQARFARDFTQMQAWGLPVYHTWAFGTLRQLGAAAELAALHLVWLAPEEAELQEAAAQFLRVAHGAKVLILKAARSVNSRKPWDVAAALEETCEAWQAAITHVGRIR